MYFELLLLQTYIIPLLLKLYLSCAVWHDNKFNFKKMAIARAEEMLIGEKKMLVGLAFPAKTRKRSQAKLLLTFAASWACWRISCHCSHCKGKQWPFIVRLQLEISSDLFHSCHPAEHSNYSFGTILLEKVIVY